MATALKAGARFKSAVCDTQVMVVKAPAGEHDLRCGGAEMIAPTVAGSGGAPDAARTGARSAGAPAPDP